MALLVAWTAYSRPGVRPAGAGPDDFWSWLSRGHGSWDAIAVNSMLAGLILPLFLATQLGRIALHVRDDTETARMAGLEATTLVACWIASILGWLLVPSSIVTYGPDLLGALISVSAPVLFSWLIAFATPAESRRLAQVREPGRRAEALRLAAEYDRALRAHFGSAPGGGVSSRRLWIDVWRQGALVGLIPATLVALRKMALTGFDGVGSALLVLAVSALVFAGLYALSTYVIVGSEVARLFGGRRAFLAYSVPLLSVPVLGVVLTAGWIAAGDWTQAGIAAVLFVAPTLVAAVRAGARLTVALVNRGLRSRAAVLQRAHREATAMGSTSAASPRPAPSGAGA